MWSLFAGAVGLIIRMLEQRFGWLGRLMLRFVGVFWSVASIFAIPGIVREPKANPITLLRNSAVTLKKTWGESLIGYIGIKFAVTAATIGSFIVVFAIFMISMLLHHPALGFSVGIVWFLAAISLSYAAAVAGHIYRGALYLYAFDGTPPGPFTQELMNAAWKTKRS
jgi:hypothetical protein